MCSRQTTLFKLLLNRTSWQTSGRSYLIFYKVERIEVQNGIQVKKTLIRAQQESTQSSLLSIKASMTWVATFLSLLWLQTISSLFRSLNLRPQLQRRAPIRSISRPIFRSNWQKWPLKAVRGIQTSSQVTPSQWTELFQRSLLQNWTSWQGNRGTIWAQVITVTMEYKGSCNPRDKPEWTTLTWLWISTTHSGMRCGTLMLLRPKNQTMEIPHATKENSKTLLTCIILFRNIYCDPLIF